MARITIRDLNDDIHEALTTSAVLNHRSTEAEIRYALQTYINSLSQPQTATYRQAWQLGTGQRIDQLIQRLRNDSKFIDTSDYHIIQVARTIGEDSPAYFLDCLQGLACPSFGMLERLIRWSQCSPDWLLTGMGSMFHVSRIGTSDKNFFLQDYDNKNVSFHFIRVTGSRYDGDLLCIRHNTETEEYAIGTTGESFRLKNNMGSGGHGNLLRFIKFLKSYYHGRSPKSYDYINSDNSELGFHQPSYYLRNSESSNWLPSLFEGRDPSDWLTGYASAWQDVKNLPLE